VSKLLDMWRDIHFGVCKKGRLDDLCMVRAEGLEPSRALQPNGFSCHLRLSPPPFGVCGLDYPFTFAFAVGAARLVSTPSRPKSVIAPARLGSGSPFHRVPRI
jgi:hypothetical protein